MHISRALDSLCLFVSGRKEASRIVQKDWPSLPISNDAFSCLPEEIILQIIEAAYYEEGLDPDVQFLSSCALVCKRWSVPSQTLLFRHVVLRSSSAFVAFRSAVDPTTIRGQALRSNVVRLRIVIDHNHPNQLSHRALAEAILSCPNLYELDLAVFDCGVPGSAAGGATGVGIFRAAPSFDAGTLDRLRSGPAIRSLKFANWSDNDQLAFQLLSDVWPSLTAVSLKGTPPRLPALDDSPIFPFSCELTELRVGFQTTPHAEFISWLLRDSSRSLRCLEIEEDFGAVFLGTLLREYGYSNSIDSLALPSCTSRDHAALIRGCGKLKEFRFESPNISPHLLKQLPASVEHLAISVTRDTPLYLIVNFIKARRYLKAITAHVWDDAESHPQMPNLRIACACNGAELLVVRGIRRFREAVRGDPVPYSSYPRFKGPENLRKMLCISRHARNDGNATHRPSPRAASAASILPRPVFASPEFAAANEMTIAADGYREKL